MLRQSTEGSLDVNLTHLAISNFCAVTTIQFAKARSALSDVSIFWNKWSKEFGSKVSMHSFGHLFQYSLIND